MEAVIFIGIQASGKSTFYKEFFFNTHMRISMDLLNTRNKEQKFLDTCFSVHQPFVVDNTNPTFEERKKYILQSKGNKYKVIGYYFKSDFDSALRRNSKRKECIPEVGIKSTCKKLQIPDFSEGFDELYYVEIMDDTFIIKEWENEI